MFLDRFLLNRRGVELTLEERSLLEGAISEIRSVNSRQTIIEAGENVSVSTFLLEGIRVRLENQG